MITSQGQSNAPDFIAIRQGDPEATEDAVRRLWFIAQANQGATGAFDRLVAEGPIPFTTTWTASTPPSLGDGTLVGQHFVRNRVRFFQLVLTIGSTTTTGTGAWVFTTPTQLDPSFMLCAEVTALEQGVAWHVGNAVVQDDQTFYVVQDGNAAGFDASVPFTWGAGDVLTVNGYYLEV